MVTNQHLNRGQFYGLLMGATGYPPRASLFIKAHILLHPGQVFKDISYGAKEPENKEKQIYETLSFYSVTLRLTLPCSGA
jgi:hypothetical protein